MVGLRGKTIAPGVSSRDILLAASRISPGCSGGGSGGRAIVNSGSRVRKRHQTTKMSGQRGGSGPSDSRSGKESAFRRDSEICKARDSVCAQLHSSNSSQEKEKSCTIEGPYGPQVPQEAAFPPLGCEKSKCLIVQSEQLRRSAEADCLDSFNVKAWQVGSIGPKQCAYCARVAGVYAACRGFLKVFLGSAVQRYSLATTWRVVGLSVGVCATVSEMYLSGGGDARERFSTIVRNRH